jgi:hypothetical protein
MDESSTTTVADDERPAPPLAPGRPVSLKPAALVIGLAALVLIVFAAGAVVFKAAPAKTNDNTAQSVAGTSLRAVGPNGALKPLIGGGQPPTNVLNAITVPAGLHRLSTINYAAEASQYDESATFTVRGTQAALIDFFTVEMKKSGWQIESTGPADNQPGIEVLGQIGGDDGWFWEMGAVVRASTFGPSGEGAAETQFTLRLIQEPDAD